MDLSIISVHNNDNTVLTKLIWVHIDVTVTSLKQSLTGK